VSITSWAQTARVKGVIMDENGSLVSNVNVVAGTSVTTSDNTGFYMLTVTANQEITLQFTHVSLKKTTATINLAPNEDFEFNIVMNDTAEQMSEVVITTTNRARVQGITTIEP